MPNSGLRAKPLAPSLREPCGECSMLVEIGEYHPYAFCVLHRAGLNPWTTVRLIAGQVGLPDPGETPPRVWEIYS